jgi:ubiquinol-cytochrome c reductase cytochrome c1 subunit
MRYGFITILMIFSQALAGESLSPKKVVWPFEGLLGKFDKQSAQRGFQVYKEVCAPCHSMKHMAYRNLEEIGFSKEEVKEIASQYTLTDGPNNSGEMFERAALPSDRFVSPFPNEQASRYANNGAYPPDLSLIVKARPNGANYIFSLLTGYREPPKNFELTDGLYYNPYFPGKQIGMPQPLSDAQVNYTDGTNPSIEQMSRDLVIFFQWSAEPEMEYRKSMGIKVLAFLLIFTVMFYIVNKRIWSTIK